MCWGAPPLEHFRLVWDNLRDGGHTHNGIVGVGSHSRVAKISWCIYETLRKSDAEFLLNTAQTIWLARDARKQRLLLRFRAVGFKNGELVSRVGVLGQFKDYETDAAGIADATEAIVQAAMANGKDLPAGLRGNALRASANARGASPDEANDANTILQKVEALTVDAAADELLAGELMRGRCNLGQDRVMCPNLKLVVRDKTHASRRTTQKPETCDAFLTELVCKLFTDKGSITQLIHHSHVWSAHFATYVQDVEEKIGKGIKNVKGAKHRHESAAKPRGRFVLLMDAYLQVARHMLHGRQDDTRKHAEGFLSYISEEVALQAAMLADATDEGLLFTRALDNECTDSAQMQFLVEDFITTLQSLLCDRMCLDLEGTYTNFMLESLQRPRVFSSTRSGPECRLGGRPVPTDIVDRCIERMVRYVKLAVAVTVAEFPFFDLFCSFQVFHLDSRDALLAAGAPNGRLEDAETRVARRRNALCASMGLDQHLSKLARFFGVDAAGMRNQYTELRHCAQKHKSVTHCDNPSAWREAVRRYSSRFQHLENHPYKDIIHVLMRYVCFSISTAAVEQNFQVFKRTFGEQGLGGGNAFENRQVKLILSRHTTLETDATVFLKAQQVYVDYGGVDKGTYAGRRDAGLPRPQGENNSEGQWLKRRRAVVWQAAAKRPRVKLEEAVVALDEDGDDTEKGAKLRRKQRVKYDRTKVEAYLDGALEEDPDLAEQAGEEVRRRDRLARERKNFKSRVVAVTTKGKVKLPDGDVYVDPDVDTPELSCQLRQASRSRCPRETARIFIVGDVTDPGQRCHWCAVLNGGFLVTPRAFKSDDDDNAGPIICFKRSAPRTIHMTAQFRAKHTEVARLLTNMEGWKFIDDLGAYVDKYRRCKNNFASMALLKRKSERVELRKHVYDVDQFLTFLRVVDNAQSRTGACKR